MDKKFGFLIGVLIIMAVFAVLYDNHPPDVVRIGYLANDHHSAALMVAQSKGMFEKEGLKVELTQFNVGSDMVIAMAAGKIDVGYVGTAPTTMAIGKGMPLKIVAAVNEEGSGIVVAKNSTINNLSDFNGKLVIPAKGSIQDILLNYMFQQNNISSANVNVMEMDLSLMPNALQSGLVDGSIVWEPYVTMASTEGYGKTLILSSEIWKNHPCCVIVSSDNFRNNHPDKLRTLLKIHKEATNYINNNPDDAALLLSQKFKIDLASEKVILGNIKFMAEPDEDFINNDLKIVDIQMDLGYLKENLTREDIFDLQYLP
jgi:NitT/TauT family transport system substrate-binding protein